MVKNFQSIVVSLLTFIAMTLIVLLVVVLFSSPNSYALREANASLSRIGTQLYNIQILLEKKQWETPTNAEEWHCEGSRYCDDIAKWGRCVAPSQTGNPDLCDDISEYDLSAKIMGQGFSEGEKR